MPVTNRHIVIDSGSTRNPTSTLKPPAGNQLNSVWVNAWCSPPSSPRRPRNTTTVATNEPADHQRWPASRRAARRARGPTHEQHQEPGEGQRGDQPGEVEHVRDQPFSTDDVVGGGARGAAAGWTR